jgi:hypothetical protein
MSVPATSIVHWPGKDTPACEDHSRKLMSLGSAVFGIAVSATPNVDLSVVCSNCENEAKARKLPRLEGAQ